MFFFVIVVLAFLLSFYRLIGSNQCEITQKQQQYKQQEVLDEEPALIAAKKNSSHTWWWCGCCFLLLLFQVLFRVLGMCIFRVSKRHRNIVNNIFVVAVVICEVKSETNQIKLERREILDIHARR